jgi:hypothetical protein
MVRLAFGLWTCAGAMSIAPADLDTELGSGWCGDLQPPPSPDGEEDLPSIVPRLYFGMRQSPFREDRDGSLTPAVRHHRRAEWRPATVILAASSSGATGRYCRCGKPPGAGKHPSFAVSLFNYSSMTRPRSFLLIWLCSL